MKVLIAGATGLVGNELGKALCKKGYKLVVLTRNPSESYKRCPFPHKALDWNEFSSHKETQDIDYIINLAGAGLADRRWNTAYKKTILESRTQTTSQLVEFANLKGTQIKSFVSTSAVGYYGDCKDKVIDETNESANTFTAKICREWEKPINKMTGARVVIFRVGVVLSEKGGALEKMIPPIQMGFGGPLGSGNQYMSWIDIDDLVSLYIFALENNIQGTFNACSPQSVRNKTLTQTIARRLNRYASFNVPYIVLRLAVGEMASALVESQNISSQKIQNTGFQFKYDSIESSIEKRVPVLAKTEKRAIYEQWVPQDKNDIFPFFSEAKNLESLTPEYLHLKTLNSSTESIKEGTEIDYKLKISSVPIRWRTLITHWDPPRSFVDTQKSGPYKKWHHTHKFATLAHGTLMTDQIDYIVPMGLLGFAITHWKVLSDIQKIFKYRREIVHKLFYQSQN